MRARLRRSAAAPPLVALALVGALCRPAHAAEKLVVAALPFVSSAPVFLAEERGLYAREGLEVELKMFQAAQPVALAVAAGDADLGVTGLTAGFYNLAARGALRIVAGQARVEPGYEFLAWVAASRGAGADLTSLDGLEGRRVGVTQIGSTFHYMLGRLAEKRGLDLRRIHLVPLESIGNVVAALRGGSIDAALLPAHLARPLEQEGAVRRLGWAWEDTPWQLGAVFASARVVERRRAPIEAWLRAYREACRIYVEELLDGRSASDGGNAARGVASALTRWVPAPVEEILASAPYIDPGAALDVASIREQIAWFQKHDLVDRRLVPDSLFVSALGRPAREE